MSIDDSVSVYRKLLEKWVRSSLADLYSCLDRPELACYGSGDNGWGVQTNQKAFAAYAALAADREFDPDAAGLSREELIHIALRTLRFSLQSHIEGNYCCTDGGSWGHTWISALGIERMMHGVDAIAEEMTSADHELLRKVLLSECDWLLDELEIEAGLLASEGHNKPESNLWNGALLHRTALLYPDAARAEQFREKGLAFLINSVSVPSDAVNRTIKDGKTVADRHVGANFFESMALNHHGYLNVGYMVICLSNMAMLHFYYKNRSIPVPEALYHNIEPLWKLVKACTFPDGRLLRIGGDTRVRYTYCQDYVIPVWHMVRDILADSECSDFEERWLQLVQLEMEENGDGSFFSSRNQVLREESPLYYARLESDRAVALSMGLAWKPLIDAAGVSKLESESRSPADLEAEGEAWHDAWHGAYLHKNANRIASWVWEAAEKPQGLCLPANESGMAEWKENLAPQITGLGRFTEQRLERHEGAMFEGGFLTWGSTLHHTSGLLAEGQPDHNIARSRIVCAALPHGAMIVLQLTTALERRAYIRGMKGLHLIMPNDLFNGNQRNYEFEDGSLTLLGAGNCDQQTVSTGSHWLNMDDKLGVIAAYGAEELVIHRPGRRQIGLRENLKTAGTGGMLYGDEICAPYEGELRSLDAGEILVDAGFVIQANQTAKATRSAGNDIRPVHHESGNVRGVIVREADGHSYALAVNWEDEEQVLSLDARAAVNLLTKTLIPSNSNRKVTIQLTPGEARLLRIEEP
ncbi:hypothetical protein [Paenibacillus sp. HB172176]|uniref:hypothetical protein n=1 Tax=Paenibacillus sp. HB172176 TaxID=2493690 RepID=UPI00143BB318|nr:hypothetical protein [Paenibacillus sp. HB172176]